MVSTVDDDAVEFPEYFAVSIISIDQPSAVKIGSPNMTFITIEDNEPGNIHPCIISSIYTYTLGVWIVTLCVCVCVCVRAHASAHTRKWLVCSRTVQLRTELWSIWVQIYSLIASTHSSSAAIQVLFDPQNYTVTEGYLVNITLVAISPPGGYEFDFTVTLQAMNGSAVGESFYSSDQQDWWSLVYTISHYYIITVSLPSTWQLVMTMYLFHTLWASLLV